MLTYDCPIFLWLLRIREGCLWSSTNRLESSWWSGTWQSDICFPRSSRCTFLLKIAGNLGEMGLRFLDRRIAYARGTFLRNCWVTLTIVSFQSILWISQHQFGWIYASRKWNCYWKVLLSWCTRRQGSMSYQISWCLIGVKREIFPSWLRLNFCWKYQASWARFHLHSFSLTYHLCFGWLCSSFRSS